MLLNDKQIIQRVKKYDMINPFVDHLVSEGVISYGLSSAGYDIRVGYEFKIFTPGPYNVTVDPKAMDVRAFVDFRGEVCTIPPNSYVLGHSVEYFDIPDDIVCIVLGKSSYARAGIACNITPGEPGWRGQWTIEIANQTPLPAKVYANEGIAQVLFWQMDRPSVTYADRDGKYQDQRGVVPARVK